MELLKESLDDMPAELNEQGKLTAGLVMLLKKSREEGDRRNPATSGGQGEALP